MKYKLFAILLLIFVLLCVGCSTQKEDTAQKEDSDSKIANPAAVHCEENGYQSVIRTNPDGSQYGVCIFPDGSECEEWAYFRGECHENE